MQKLTNFKFQSVICKLLLTIFLSVCIIFSICVYHSFAEVPCMINYQGRLIKDNKPVHNPTGVPMTFTVDGIQVYSGDVPVYNGLFRVVLDLENIDWTAGEEKSLEVTVDGEPLSPPEPIYAYPYAINSHLLEGSTKEHFINVSGETQKKDGGLNIMGDVGIGTTNLGTRKLKVDGEVEATKYYGDGSALTGIDTGKWDGLKPGDIYYNEGNVGIGTTGPLEVKLEVDGNIKAHNIWMKIAEVDLTNSTGYTISGLNGNAQKMYKVIFQGSIKEAGGERHILIRPNGISSGYSSFACWDGNSGGSNWDDSGFYVGFNGWSLNADFTFEYTISAITGRRRVGFGESTFWHTGGLILGFGRASGYWDDIDTNITSLWVGPNGGGTISGNLMVFALE